MPLPPAVHKPVTAQCGNCGGRGTPDGLSQCTWCLGTGSVPPPARP
jgi:hypothetical protein